MRTSVIIPAAGSGKRMGSGVHKQFLTLRGIPIIVVTLERFQKCSAIHEIVIAVQEAHRRTIESLVSDYHLSKVVKIVEGGERRQDSVANALGQIDPRAEIVLVHDAVRPFVQQSIIREAIEKAEKFSASVVAIRARDTVKAENGKGAFHKTLDRSVLWLAQTPQAFRKELLVKAYAKARRAKVEATDDASLVERLRIHPAIVEGSPDNIKITTPADLDLAELVARRFKD